MNVPPAIALHIPFVPSLIPLIYIPKITADAFKIE